MPTEWERVQGAPAYTLQIATRDFDTGAPTRYTSKIELTPEQAETVLDSLPAAGLK